MITKEPVLQGAYIRPSANTTKRKSAFGKLPLGSILAFQTKDVRDAVAADWRKNPSLVVRTFTRGVRAGGAAITIYVLVARRKVGA